MTDSRRREFVLNVLLTGLLFAATVALLFTCYNYFVSHLGQHSTGVLLTFVFWLIVLALLITSRMGKSSVAAFIFVAFLLLSGIQFAVVWGFGLAIAELIFVLTIVIAGVLFSSRFALVATFVVAASLVTITYLQVGHIQNPSMYWQTQTPEASDVMGYVVIFVVIGLVSWLSNRETDQSLQRARRSEAALKQERDNLEAKVLERTQELEAEQLARLLELQPFAEFGRIGAGLVHEIANPLTAASLHLQMLNRVQESELVRDAQRSLHQLERYLLSARKQLKRKSRPRMFAVRAEVKQVVALLGDRARRANVQISAGKIASVKLYGDVVKFNQLVANLLANAIDASASESSHKNRVSIAAMQEGAWLTIVVTDFGSGISSEQAQHLFEPFYTTKKSLRRGLGIGLAMVKQFVEEDFGGSITVSSDPVGGTIFTIHIPIREKP